MNDDWIKDKVAIITGGASGIGQATAFAAAKRGATVVIADIDEKLGKETSAMIYDKGHQCHFIPTDVTDKRSIADLVLSASELGPIHFLVNSAGLQTYGTVETTTEEVWDQTMNINVKSMYLVANQVIPEIKKNTGGAIVNISSVQGIRSQKNVAAYATSKAAAIALTRTMGLDFSSEGIRVNCICPGSIDTPMLRFGAAQHGEENEVLKEWGSSHPIGRVGTPEEIAKTALFLMSPDAAFIVGQPIVADGGLGSIIL
ncbi:MAG: SDR family oxidoreductase [Ekhidna sp.]|nr:SDR family oxidoreductase [Ekhidna sp.]